jgi:hypothetical protein
VNLFSRYPTASLLAVSGSASAPHMMEGGHRVLPGAAGVPGRLVELLRPRLGEVDAFWTSVKPLAIVNEIARFNPELVLAVPTHPVGVALAERLGVIAPLVTYLMDDWMGHLEGSRLIFDAATRGTALLHRSEAWLAISTYLLEAMRATTGTDRPALVVHNPVRLGESPPAALAAPRTGRFRVAYAGSVWPMHWDAVKAVAESVARLRTTGEDVEFVLYTDRFFWGRHEADWRRWGVVDGGLVPYDRLGATLADCDLLVVASSWEPSQAHMSRSSVQTKVTDYMAAGRPILACGPSDAASNRFLREHACAYFAEDPAPAAMDAALRHCMADRAHGPEVARRAWDVARREHELVGVTERLYAFLGDIDGRR